MKLVFLFVGLISLLFFNYGEIKSKSNYQTFSISDKSCKIETGNPDPIWNCEKNESYFFTSTDEKLTQGKKRTCGFLFFFSKNSFKNKTKLSDCIHIPISKSNLFLIFQFSLSLWGVFLQ
jgi:hypothetical protein